MKPTHKHPKVLWPLRLILKPRPQSGLHHLQARVFGWFKDRKIYLLHVLVKKYDGTGNQHI